MNFQTIAASKPQGTLPSDGVPLKKNLPDRQRLVRKLKACTRTGETGRTGGKR